LASTLESIKIDSNESINQSECDAMVASCMDDYLSRSSIFSIILLLLLLKFF